MDSSTSDGVLGAEASERCRSFLAIGETLWAIECDEEEQCMRHSSIVFVLSRKRSYISTINTLQHLKQDPASTTAITTLSNTKNDLDIGCRRALC